MSYIENTCKLIRGKSYKKAADTIASYTFEERFLRLNSHKRTSVVQSITKRLETIHRKLRRERYPSRMTEDHRMELAWETYHELVNGPFMGSLTTP